MLMGFRNKICDNTMLIILLNVLAECIFNVNDYGTLSVNFISFQQCTQHGGACNTTIDGYYVESVVLIAVGFLWYIWKYKKVKQLDRLHISAWKCS
jgi:hypothetical protein